MARTLKRTARIARVAPALFGVLLVILTPLCSLTEAVLGAQSTERARTLNGSEGVATFAAQATFGAFTGRTRAVMGAVSTVRGPAEATGWMEVMLDSLRTGQGTRDRHMREALETTQFPTARFELDSLRLEDTDSDVFADNVTIAVRLHGRFRVHGVWRAVVATGTIYQASPNAWRLNASFPVKLADHNITKGLSRAFGAIRVEQEIRITIASEFSAG